MRLQLSGIGSGPAPFSDESPIAARVPPSTGMADDMTRLLDAMRAASAGAWGAEGLADEDDDDGLDSIVSAASEDDEEELDDDEDDEKTPS